MARIITFGELMLRLQPYNYERFVQCDHVEFTFGGGEANVAVSLANYGMDAAFVTKLPAHAIGQAAVNSLRRYGVDTSEIVRGGDRVGISRERLRGLLGIVPIIGLGKCIASGLVLLILVRVVTLCEVEHLARVPDLLRVRRVLVVL